MSIHERFLKYTNKTDGCWLWTAGINHAGYGRMSRTRKLGPALAHRISYELHVGKIPKNRCVLHICDVPRCVNPKHLYLGTRIDNAKDRVDRGRATKGEKCSWALVTEKDVRAIRASKEMQVTLAARYGVSTTCIRHIIRRLNWKHVI